MSALFSGALVAGIGGRVFGQPFSVTGSLAVLRKRLVLFAVWIFLFRAGQLVLSFCLVLPAVLLVPWAAFLAEILFLEQIPARQVTRRMSGLAHGHFGVLLGRFLLLAMFFVLLVTGLFIALDSAAVFLFNIPAWFDRVESTPYDGPWWHVALSEPLTGTMVHACMWIATPLARLAWFFCYLDIRIRGECWDLDVAFQVEANRLAGVT
jgi:hypothetical protein